MSTKSNASVQVRLLDDKPADNSSFKSHEDVSKAISSLILHEDEGKTVGLFGSWGSGKSTAAGLIEKKLKEKSKGIEVFTFDAWLHGTDPLRRSFIEKLIEFYGTDTEDRKKYINKSSEKYVSLINEITRRKEDQTVKTTPKIKPEGLIIAVAYIASISFAGFLMKGFEKFETSIWSIEWVVWLGLIVWPLFLLATK